MAIDKQIMDFLYGTEKVKRKFSSENQDEKIYAADASKAIVTKNQNDIKRGPEWVSSQRAVVLLTDKRILCGDYNIPLDDIKDAELVKIRSALGSGQVLKITTKDEINYQFGMQVNSEWREQNILPLQYDNGKVKLSVFSLFIRIVLIGIILYIIYDSFLSNGG